MFEEVRVNEFFDMQEKGLFEDGATAGKHVLSAKGENEFERLVESLPAKHQVFIRMMVDGNAEKSVAEIKALMQ